MKVFLRKQKGNSDKELTTVYFNSTAKRVINLKKYSLSNLFNKFYID